MRKRGTRDHPEAALGTDEQTMQSRTGRRFLHCTRCATISPLGKHSLQSQNLIAHGAILAAEVSEAVGGNRAADRRHRKGPRIVPAHQAVRFG